MRDGALVSDSFGLKLLFPGELGLSSQPKSKRTIISLLGTGKDWKLKPEVASLPIGTLAASDGLFDRIYVEAGEGAANDVAHTLMATSFRSDGLGLEVAGGISNLDGAPFSLALADPVYAIAFDPTPDQTRGDQTTLSARFSPSPAWLSVEGFALEVGDAAARGFEADTLKGAVTSVHGTPALLTAAVPLLSPSGEHLVASPLGPTVPQLPGIDTNRSVCYS